MKNEKYTPEQQAFIDAWVKWDRLCSDHDYTKCLKCGKPGTFFEEVRMLHFISSVPSTYQRKNCVCKYCGEPKPWLDWRGYGVSKEEVEKNLRDQNDFPPDLRKEGSPWRRVPLWAI